MLQYKKMLHRVNFEDVSIEAKLERSYYRVGEQVNGVVEVVGGSKETEVGYLYLYLKSEYVKNPAQPLVRTEVKLEKIIIGKPFYIKVNEVIHIPFSFILPFHTPITLASTKVFTHTGLDVHAGDDPEDIDYIEVGPTLLQERIFKAIELLGYQKQRAVYGPAEHSREFLQLFRYERTDDPNHKITLSLETSSYDVFVKIHEKENDDLDQVAAIHQHDSEHVILNKFMKILKPVAN